MTGAWITNIRHFLDEQGRVPADLPAVPRYICELTEAASSLARGHVIPLEVRCRRRPGRQSCPGIIHAHVDVATAEISWHCPCCGDHGTIYNWEGTSLDRREPAVAGGEAATTPGPAGFSPRAAAAWNNIPPIIRVRLLNNFWCGTCLGEASVDLQSGQVSAGNLILRGNCTRCGSAIARVVEDVGRS